MISRGWIFPDGTEYEIRNIDNHVTVLLNFFYKIKSKNLELYEKIYDEIDEGQWLLRLEYYAILRLGWILVGNAYRMRISCAGYEFQKEYIIPYEELGWTITNLYASESNFLKIDIRPV